MGVFFIGCALGFVFVGCIAAPFLAPWRVRVRYLVNAQVADPVFGIGPPRDVTLREVQLTSVAADRGHVDLVVERVAGAPSSRRRVLTREQCEPAIVAKLDGWSATHELLLMVDDESGDIHLFGPNGAVTYLNRVEERTR